MPPRYPDIQVRLHSHNPLALVSAVRLALRKSDVDAAEIHRFTSEAMGSPEPEQIRDVCAAWAAVDLC